MNAVDTGFIAEEAEAIEECWKTEEDFGSEVYWDGVNGVVLLKVGVAAARKLELEWIVAKGVFDKVERTPETGKLLTLKLTHASQMDWCGLDWW